VYEHIYISVFECWVGTFVYEKSACMGVWRWPMGKFIVHGRGDYRIQGRARAVANSERTPCAATAKRYGHVGVAPGCGMMCRR
jgi:hypothetical protein